ncbi:MAG: DUF167 domain-containing protein [Alphaproteobacteria bacterium]|nr:DUF167 domain-containing protein [Alphaproteobacteria bacterium]
MRRINLRVIPRAKQAKIIETDGVYRVYITAAPVDGAANAAVIKILSEYFDVPKTQIQIVRGQTARDKVVELPDL